MDSKTNAKGDIILSVNGTKLVFRQPTGRDLVSLERIVEMGKNTDAETLADILAQLSVDSLDADYFLDLPLGTFTEVGGTILTYFRSKDK